MIGGGGGGQGDRQLQPGAIVGHGLVEREGRGVEVAGAVRREPRVDRWIFSTDGVGFPVPTDDATIAVPARKAWVTSGAVKHPAMLGFGPGIEQNTHKVGECVDLRELVHAIAFLARSWWSRSSWEPR